MIEALLQTFIFIKKTHFPLDGFKSVLVLLQVIFNCHRSNMSTSFIHINPV